MASHRDFITYSATGTARRARVAPPAESLIAPAEQRRTTLQNSYEQGLPDFRRRLSAIAIAPERLVWNPRDNSPVEQGGTLLGRNDHSSVHVGTMDGEKVAIKVLRSASPASSSQWHNAAVETHKRNLSRLAELRFRHIVAVYGITSFPHSTEPAVVSEYVSGGSLQKSLRRAQAAGSLVDDATFLIVSWHIVKGLWNLHSEGMSHGDLKPENVLLTEPFHIDTERKSARLPAHGMAKLVDFAKSTRLRNVPRLFDVTTVAIKWESFGTYAYMAPECYGDMQSFTDEQFMAVDVYALGHVMYYLLTGREPWSVEDPRTVSELCQLLQENKRPGWGPEGNRIKTQYKDLVESCWSNAARHRPTAKDLGQIFRRWSEVPVSPVPSASLTSTRSTAMSLSPIVSPMSSVEHPSTHSLHHILQNSSESGRSFPASSSHRAALSQEHAFVDSTDSLDPESLLMDAALGPLHTVSAANVVDAFRQNNRALVMQWWHSGHKETIACAVAAYKSREHPLRCFALVSDLLGSTAEDVEKRPQIARDLCTALGRASKFERVGTEQAARGIRNVLDTLYTFTGNVRVYSAAMYALAEMMRFCNEFDENSAREVIGWISHAASLSWKEDYSKQEPGMAYMAASAARIFAWDKVENARLFFESPTNVPSPVETLRDIMLLFSREPKVAGACASVLAVLASFPVYRTRLTRLKVILTIAGSMDTFSKNVRDSLPMNCAVESETVLSMGYAALGLFVRRPESDPVTRRLISDGFLEKNGLGPVASDGISIMLKVLEHCVKERSFAVVEEGIFSLSRVVAFDSKLASAVLSRNGVPTVIRAVRCVVDSGTQNVGRRCAESICNVLRVLSFFPEAVQDMRTKKVNEPLRTLLAVHKENQNVKVPAIQLIERLK